jgi:hypothetical protein
LAIIWYANELKKIQNLKTAVDFQREKDAKAQKEQAQKEAKARKEQGAYERTDAGSIKKSIKIAFEKWNQKGEFEKETDFNNRLKNQSKAVFSQVCIEQIKSIINDYNRNRLKRELSSYQTEKEYFIVSFNINEIKMKWQNQINIPISNAENFKKNWPALQSEFSVYDWCFVGNSLCPTLVYLYDANEKSKYKFPLSPENQSEITISFNDLGIDNPYLQSYVFKYSDTKLEEEYQKNGNLFASREEFDAFINKGDSIYMHELKRRQVFADMDTHKDFIKSMDFQKEKSESLGSKFGRGLLNTATDANVAAKDYSGENATRKNILSSISSSKGEPYYAKIIDFIVETNEDMNKEWVKSGSSFESKIEFYEAYTSDYKKILKEKKKK